MRYQSSDTDTQPVDMASTAVLAGDGTAQFATLRSDSLDTAIIAALDITRASNSSSMRAMSSRASLTTQTASNHMNEDAILA